MTYEAWGDLIDKYCAGKAQRPKITEIYVDWAIDRFGLMQGIENLRKELAKLREELDAYQYNISEALNSGDGVYRP